MTGSRRNAAATIERLALRGVVRALPVLVVVLVLIGSSAGAS